MAMLQERKSLSEIATALGKNRSTIQREIKGHRASIGAGDLQRCPMLERPPFVCNGCVRFATCRLQRFVYVAQSAQNGYRETLVRARSGMNISPEELRRLDEVVSAGVRKGQSVHHVMASSADQIMVCEKTVYRYVNEGLLDVRRHHLPRAPYRKPRKSLKPRKSRGRRRIDRECLRGRTFDDWKAFMEGNPRMETVEIDSVIGKVGGKCLLTMHLNSCGLMLAFLRDHNDARSVKDVFAGLFRTLGARLFGEIFSVLLADNGTEFSDPDGIECPAGTGQRLARLFYCNPYASYEKPHVENNHENLRRILPKGTGFDNLTQADVNLAMSHVNSMRRKEYGDRTAIERFVRKFGGKTLALLGLHPVPDAEVCLLPALLKKG
jgi:IS30 family transposase